MRRVHLAACLCAVALAAAGCGGGDHPSARPTATPSPTPQADRLPPGIDRKQLNDARTQLVAACKRLDAADKPDPDDVSIVRASVKTYLTAFRASPDDEFSRSTNSPKITMRELLSSTQGYLRESCGDGTRQLADRLRRAARRGASSG